MADRETHPFLSHDTSPVTDVSVEGGQHTPGIDDAALLELQGVFYEPVDTKAEDELSIAARSEAIAVMPTHMLGRYIKEKTKSLSAEADLASQNPPTIMSSSKERIEYASRMALLAGQKLVLRDLLELLMDGTASSQAQFRDKQEPLTE